MPPIPAPAPAAGPAPRGLRPITLLWVLLGSLPLLIALGGGGGAWIAHRQNLRDEARTAAQSQLLPSSPASADPSPRSSGTPVPAPSWLTGRTEPRLVDAQEKPVLGPVYAARDATYTAAFQGWPFAFRVPPAWNCVDGVTLPTAPDAYRKVCVDESVPGSNRSVVLALQHCVNNCTAAKLKTQALAWLAKSGKVTQFDNRTWYAVTNPAANGDYLLELVHRFVVDDRQYIVAVYATAPYGDRAVIQKIVNSIVSQAG